jgi:S1-C subfamily serine protease
MRSIYGILVLVCLLLTTPLEAKDTMRDSVVKVYATLRAPDFVRPWTKLAPQESVGSGVVIDGNRILTNAHVVAYSTQVFVQANESTDKLTARVDVIAPEVDLAVIRLDDESFFDTHPSLALADKIPVVKDKVTVYGYPVGGEQLSVTEGIVSRLEFARYHSIVPGLRIQIDAAVNPGNSGGPVVSDGQMVGLVFSKMQQAENIGYIIPAEEIARFLQNIPDGVYHGKPTFFIQVQSVENEALRAKLGLNKDDGGVMVTDIGSKDASYPLKPWDVLTQLGTYKLDKKGNVQIRDDLWLPSPFLIPKLVHNNTIPATVIREGKRLEVEIPVSAESHLLLPPLLGKYPRYFVHGPLVFTEASQELVAAINSHAEFRDHLAQIRNPLISKQWNRKKTPDEELVILGRGLLDHPITKGYDAQTFAVVAKINGVAVNNLTHLVELLRDADSEYMTFELAGDYETLVFRREALKKATETILANEDIRSQGSEDLLKIWQQGK